MRRKEIERIAICDDDLIYSQLNNIISNYIKSRNILADIITFSSGKDLCESIQTMNISCLFIFAVMVTSANLLKIPLLNLLATLISYILMKILLFNIPVLKEFRKDLINFFILIF